MSVPCTLPLHFEKHAAANDRSASNWYAIAEKPRRESRQLLQTCFHEIRTLIRDGGVRDCIFTTRSIDRSLNALSHSYYLNLSNRVIGSYNETFLVISLFFFLRNLRYSITYIS